MNCANHPETPSVAYCQFCGKPLCDQCVHKVNNIISCEPCLAARVHASATGTYGNSKGFQYTASGPLPAGTVQPPANWGTEPAIALAVGWIPGVGAVYNGQIAKALVHVAVFALLIDMTHYNGLIGLLIPIWILYQMFDAYQTTVARRDGLPLPNPLGLNDIGRWFGTRSHVPYSGANPWTPNPATPDPANPNATSPGAGIPVPPGREPPAPGGIPVAGFAPGFGPEPYAPPVPPPMPPVPPNQYDTPDLWSSRKRGIPTGAVVLIALGVLFLLSNLGIFSDYWIGRGWPILLIGLGIWLVIRHTQTPPSGGVR